MNINTRVQIPPHTDRWMKGDRFGRVTEIVNHPSGTVARVAMDKSDDFVFFKVDELLVVDPVATEWIG